MKEEMTAMRAKRETQVKIGLVLFIIAMVWLVAAKSCSESKPAAVNPASAVAVATPALPPKPKPNYVLQDRGRYGYERESTEVEKAAGAMAGQVVLLAYAGLHDGAHQFIAIDDATMGQESPRRLTVFDYKPGEEFIKQSEFINLQLRNKTFIRRMPGMMLGLAFDDAERGFLTRYAHPMPSWGKGMTALIHCPEAQKCWADPVK